MKHILGPILGFRSSAAGIWNYCVLHVFSDLEGGAPDLIWEHMGVETKSRGAKIFEYKNSGVWVYEIAATLQPTAGSVNYRLADGTGGSAFTIPSLGSAPRIAYCSCNGFSDTKIARSTPSPEERWVALAKQHAQEPFHLLLMGGDQIYADAMWSAVPALRRWANQWRSEQVEVGLSETMEVDVREHYFNLYTENWARKATAGVLARIPTVMMWDDHDITDGWGSHPDDLQLPNAKLRRGGVLPGLFVVAKEYFESLQLRVVPGTDRPETITPGGKNLTSLHRLGPVALLVLDLRSERTRNRIVSDASWKQIVQALEKLPEDKTVKHLLVMSSVPVVYPNGGVFNGLASLIPWDPLTDPQDDLIDHWSDPHHQSERERLVRLLFKTSREKSIRITLLTGDVHVAGQTIIESNRGGQQPVNSDVITQLISSGIVHPPSGGPFALGALDQLARIEQDLYRGVVGSFVEFWSGGPCLLPKRNWLSIVPIEEDSLRAQWHVEGMEAKLTKDIGPCS